MAYTDQLVDETSTENAQQETIDFKMVTFSLGGKDYGIDIMRVKEIAKFFQFTYVPNTAHFVRGVYNLRGDIISVIDLRLFFNLPAEQKEEGQAENGLILRLENKMLGVIVDSIDKVVGIASSQVQPPHPIFGDINVKYISGVAEYDERLYIILDVDRIFGKEEEPDETAVSLQQRIAETPTEPPSPASPDLSREAPAATPRGDRDVQRQFLSDGIKAFSGFYVTPVNDRWFSTRVEEWVSQRRGEDKEYQLKEAADAENFLRTFWSQYTGAFWRGDYAAAFKRILPTSEASVYNVWNPGCGSGYETYSITAILKLVLSNQQIKVWAGDKDLLKISTAPNLVFSHGDIPEEWEELVAENANGVAFQPPIKEAILFEFSDVLSAAAMPKMDLIVARDLLSLQKPDEQSRILERFDEALKPGGVLVLGDNEEVLDPDAWEPINDVPLHVYIHR